MRRAIAILALIVGVLGGPGACAAGAIPFAPYVDETSGDHFPLADFASTTGTRDFTLGFVSAAGGNRCRASWGGNLALRSKSRRKRVAALRRAGGNVIVSFGGAGTAELATVCPSAHALANQYDAAIRAYRVRSIDFDIEGQALASGAGLARRSRAIAILQRHHPRLRVSLTLPVGLDGLAPDGLRVVRSALAHRVHHLLVNVMAFDYYDSHAVGRMAAAAEGSARATLRQLKSLLGDGSVARKLGLTLMIGVNDDPKEVFTLDDARSVADYARTKGIGRLSMWSAERDRACKAGEDPSVTHGDCSGVSQAPGAFARVLASG